MTRPSTLPPPRASAPDSVGRTGSQTLVRPARRHHVRQVPRSRTAVGTSGRGPAPGTHASGEREPRTPKLSCRAARGRRRRPPARCPARRCAVPSAEVLAPGPRCRRAQARELERVGACTQKNRGTSGTPIQPAAGGRNTPPRPCPGSSAARKPARCARAASRSARTAARSASTAGATRAATGAGTRTRRSERNTQSTSAPPSRSRTPRRCPSTRRGPRRRLRPAHRARRREATSTSGAVSGPDTRGARAVSGSSGTTEVPRGTVTAIAWSGR